MLLGKFVICCTLVYAIFAQQCSIIYSFESDLQGWQPGTGSSYPDSSATTVSQSSQHATDGTKSAEVSFNHSPSYQKAIYVVEPSSSLDFSSYDTLSFSFYKSGQPPKVALALTTGNGYIWHESTEKAVNDGDNTVTFNLKSSDWKTQASNWQFTTTVADRNNIKKVAILLFPTSGSSSAYVDKIQLCSASSAATTSGSVGTTGVSTMTTTGSTSSSTPVSGFVGVSGTHFVLNGCPFYFAGTNNYYLTYKSDFMISDVLDATVAMGYSVIRIWGFLDIGSLDGSVSSTDGQKEGVYFQYWDNGPKYNDGDNGLKRLDKAIAAASNRGLRIVLPFVNNWKEFGGMDQYVTWYGLTYHDDFYTNNQIKQDYKNYVNHLLTRVNTVTGVTYKDDPTIFAWELANEPRCKGLKSASSSCTSTTITNWVDEMSSYIKTIDNKHMVTVGDEGFFKISGSSDWIYNGGEGIDWNALLGIRTIDYGTVHMYPEHWGQTATWGNQWITQHANSSKSIGKPVVIEEFGLGDKSARQSVYNDWLTTIENNEVAADMIWMIAGRESAGGNYYPDYDGFTIYNDGSAVSEMLKLHNQRMKNKNNGCTPNVESTSSSSSSGSDVTSTAGSTNQSTSTGQTTVSTVTTASQATVSTTASQTTSNSNADGTETESSIASLITYSYFIMIICVFIL